jgi:hypothetical protein
MKAIAQFPALVCFVLGKRTGGTSFRVEPVGRTAFPGRCARKKNRSSCRVCSPPLNIALTKCLMT